MKAKKDRLQSIREIIERRKVGSQEELLQELKQLGFELTQATLSRDLKQLQVAKVPNSDGTYQYTLPSLGMSGYAKPNLMGVAMLGLNSIEFSGQLAVIKTRPGHASSVAYEIDTGDSHEILGTIAGDDTVLLILREGVTQQQAMDWLMSHLEDVKMM